LFITATFAFCTLSNEMFHIKRRFFLLSFILLFLISTHQAFSDTIVINEIMSLNASVIADEDGDSEDWIELHNSGNAIIDLSGWTLTDNRANPSKWVFPSVSIGPGEFLLIWASGKNRHEMLHANFSIDRNGENIILYDHLGIKMDEIPAVLLAPDISYGRYPDGSDNFFYFNDPTPRLPNNASEYTELLSPPVISHASGFYSEAFSVMAFHNDPDVVLRYTLDGSVPEMNSEIFKESLLIKNRVSDPELISAIPTTPMTVPESYRWFSPIGDVYKGTNFRIKAFKEGTLSPFTETRIWWVDPEIHDRYTLPVISISMNQKDLFGPSGIYTNYLSSWEKRAHISFFEPDGTPGFSTDAGISIHGGNSRRYALKSFRLYFRKEYGAGKLDYDVFESEEITIHERLLLRNAGSDWPFTYFRDPFVQSILNHFNTNVETQSYRPAIVFLNSEFWGIMNIRERYDDNYIKNYYGYSDIDMLENTGVVKYGSNEEYYYLISFLQQNDLTKEENYNQIKDVMDVENFRDYHILQVYSMNTDQPGKNVRFWKSKTPDAKWRWMWWDMDDTFSFGPHNTPDRNGLVFCTGLNNINSTQVNSATPPPFWAPNGPSQTFPLRALLKNQDFRIDFISRFADLLNTAFQPHYLHELIESFHATISPHLEEQYSRWHRPRPDVYEEHLNLLHVFAQNRVLYMRKHLVEFFNLGGQYNLNARIENGEGFLKINSLEINDNLPANLQTFDPWQGVYFSGVPVRIEAVPAPGYVFSHWTGDIQGSENPYMLNYFGKEANISAHFKPEETDHLEILSFWYFNRDLPNDEPLIKIEPWYSKFDESMLMFQSSLGPKYPFDPDHPQWRIASMERKNRPTAVNYRPELTQFQPFEAQMRGIQIRQPFRQDQDENSIILKMPTSGYANLVLSMAAMSDGAAGHLTVEYSIDDSDNWHSEGLTKSKFNLDDEFSLFRIDFSDVFAANHNDLFRVRLRFGGDHMYTQNEKTVVFNNISLEGVFMGPQATIIAQKKLSVFPNPVKGDFVFLPEKMDAILYDIRGVVLSGTEMSDRLDVSELPAGIYFLRNSFGETAKLVVYR
jgi:hypothetical protein